MAANAKLTNTDYTPDVSCNIIRFSIVLAAPVTTPPKLMIISSMMSSRISFLSVTLRNFYSHRPLTSRVTGIFSGCNIDLRHKPSGSAL